MHFGESDPIATLEHAGQLRAAQGAQVEIRVYPAATASTGTRFRLSISLARPWHSAARWNSCQPIWVRSVHDGRVSIKMTKLGVLPRYGFDHQGGVLMTSIHQHDDTVEPTLNAAVFHQIRADIVACRLAPNERLRIETLRARYGFGGSPIREALMRLEAEGLVTLEQNKGFRVSSGSRAQLHDLTATRGRDRRAGAALVDRKGRRCVGGRLAGGIPPAVAPEEDRTGRRHECDLVQRAPDAHSALVAACGSPC